MEKGCDIMKSFKKDLEAWLEETNIECMEYTIKECLNQLIREHEDFIVIAEEHEADECETRVVEYKLMLELLERGGIV